MVVCCDCGGVRLLGVSPSWPPWGCAVHKVIGRRVGSLLAHRWVAAGGLSQLAVGGRKGLGSGERSEREGECHVVRNGDKSLRGRWEKISVYQRHSSNMFCRRAS